MMPDGVTDALGVDDPHYLGPTIVATKDKAVRIVFYNLLPKGADGDLFLPTDTTLMGSGMTPGSADAVPAEPATVTDAVRNPMCTEKYYNAADARHVLHREPGHAAPPRWRDPVDQRRHPAPVDHARQRGHSVAAGRGRPERARHDRRSSSRWCARLRRRRRRLPDVLLHQPAVSAADVLPRPRLGHHPPQRVRGRSSRLRPHRPDRAEAVRPVRRPTVRVHGRGHPARHPGPHLRPVRRPARRSGPDVGLLQVGRHG